MKFRIADIKKRPEIMDCWLELDNDGKSVVLMVAYGTVQQRVLSLSGVGFKRIGSVALELGLPLNDARQVCWSDR